MRLYVIWSEKHGAWWRAYGSGYTQSLRQAGRFSQEQAEAIVANANKTVEPPDFHEIEFPDPM